MRGSKPSASAETVALARAHLHAVGVIEDPYAASFLGGRRRLLLRAFRVPLLARYTSSPTFSFLAARTLFFDEVITDAASAGVRQAVVLGAGYDARAWRLTHPEVRFFEVDHPATQRRKRRLGAQPGGTAEELLQRRHEVTA